MEPERKTIRVTIFNQTYTLAASGEPGEVEALARTIDELMTSIAPAAGNLDSNRIAVLACLHLADRLKSAEDELTRLKSRVNEKSEKLARLLDQAVK